MAKRRMILEIVDEQKTVIATTGNYKEAHKMLVMLARYTEWNRGIKITEVTESMIVFNNFDTVFIREVTFFTTAKDMALAYGFQDFTNNKRE